MDFSSPKTWQDGILAVIRAPHVVLPLVVFVMGTVWWLRGSVERSARTGLNALVEALRERLQLAHDQQAAVTSKLDAAKVQLAAVREKISQASSEPTAVAATANAVSALEMAQSANSALSYILRTAPDPHAEQWRDHATMVAMMEKTAFTVEYEDGRTGRLYVSQWEVKNGDDVVRFIARDRQREGSLPRSKIKAFRREAN